MVTSHFVCKYGEAAVRRTKPTWIGAVSGSYRKLWHFNFSRNKNSVAVNLAICGTVRAKILAEILAFSESANDFLSDFSEKWISAARWHTAAINNRNNNKYRWPLFIFNAYNEIDNFRINTNLSIGPQAGLGRNTREADVSVDPHRIGINNSNKPYSEFHLQLWQ